MGHDDQAVWRGHRFQDNSSSSLDVKKVQHPLGGIVGELRVHDGDVVKAGDVVIRLDATQTQANLAIIVEALDELAAQQAREEAERDGDADITFPEQLLTQIKDPRVARLVSGETKLFETGSRRDPVRRRSSNNA